MASLQDVSGKTVFYEYGGLRRLKCLLDERGNELVVYAYDAQNRIREARYGAGIITSYEYDVDGNVSRLWTVGVEQSQNSTVAKPQERVFLDYRYQYDGSGNRTAKDGLLWTGDEQPKQEFIRFIYNSN